MKLCPHLYFIIAIFVLSCTKDKSELKKAPVAPPPSLEYCDSMKTNNILSWKCDIDTIINTYCATSVCHGGPQLPSLNSYSNVFTQKDRIKARGVVEKTMPPAGNPLPHDSLRQKIGQWIDAGANNN